jgi:hypothetical protein
MLVSSLIASSCYYSEQVEATVEIFTFSSDSPLVYAGAGEYYSKVHDICGICNGDTTSCQGCDRVPNSSYIFDACGQCLDLSTGSGAINQTCSYCSTALGHTPELVHDHMLLDDCGQCHDPVLSFFSREGLPSFHVSGCVGCDGIPNSDNILDECGVCNGQGCALSYLDEHRASWCCDCGGIPFGFHLIDFCCQCVDRVKHWFELSGGQLFGPPPKHSLAEYMWASGREAAWNGTHELKTIVSRGANSKTVFSKSKNVYNFFLRAFEYLNLGWKAIKDPSSDDNSTCYGQLYILGGLSNPRDICGVCGGENLTCSGCNILDSNIPGDPITDGGLIIDDCAVCGGENSNVDECGMCFGNNETCTGCDGVPNSGKVIDECFGSSDFRFLNFEGNFGDVGSGCSDPLSFKRACDLGGGGCCGCDGIPDSGKSYDSCGVCTDTTNLELTNASCSGCDGVAQSGATYDTCCICGGDNNYTSPCYLDLLADKMNSVVPFDPYSMNYSSYFTAEGKVLIDECGECRSWGYNGTTCLGCDGIYGSGLIVDGCGVCGGDCSTCLANDTGFTHDCNPEVEGWSGIHKQCFLVRSEGNSAWKDWNAFPNGTVEMGAHLVNSTWYQIVNSPGASAFQKRAMGECRMFLEPPAPLQFSVRRDWVVKLHGKEEGPYTLEELERGNVPVTDTTSDKVISMPLLPTTLVARLTTSREQQIVKYGMTSQYRPRVQDWQNRTKNKVLSSPSEIGVHNTVLVEGYTTELRHDVRFMPMALMPGMEHIIYPYCTDSTWRGGDHRLHGKKLPGNYLGIITTENELEEGLVNQVWNPLNEYIYDISTGWIDTKCTCSDVWQYASQPIAPTCSKAWFPWYGWLTGSSYTSDDTQNGSVSFLKQKRSAAGGGWRVSGGWWVQDYGGGGAVQYRSLSATIYNAHGSKVVDGYGQMRGPVRIDATGSLSVSTLTPMKYSVGSVYEYDNWHDQCYSAGRLSHTRCHTAGALWSTVRENVSQSWTCSFLFSIREQPVQCEDIYSVSRSFGDAIHTRLFNRCSIVGADGFAFVIRDDTVSPPTSSDFGAFGPGLGYQGLRHSLAIEFDTWHNPLNGDPFERHVAVHSRGAEANSAHHSARLGSTISVPNFADGAEHHALISFTPDAGWDAISQALESDFFLGATNRLSRFTGDRLGLLEIYLDDMVAPILIIPLSLDKILKAQEGTAWVGFTGGTGDRWQTVDIRSWNFTSSL